LFAMRSSAGVGTTPPKVLGAPKPLSSVMMSRTLGAFFGGTTRGGHQGVDSVAFSLITPPNCGSGGGSCFPLMVVVALGEPGVPVVCISPAKHEAAVNTSAIPHRDVIVIIIILYKHLASFFNLDCDSLQGVVNFAKSWRAGERQTPGVYAPECYGAISGLPRAEPAKQPDEPSGQTTT
jgi:hypothetical protein